jgi:hypothetical protein
MTSSPPSYDELCQTPPGQPIAMTAALHKRETRVSAVFMALARALPPAGLTLQDLLARLGAGGERVRVLLSSLDRGATKHAMGYMNGVPAPDLRSPDPQHRDALRGERTMVRRADA